MSDEENNESTETEESQEQAEAETQAEEMVPKSVVSEIVEKRLVRERKKNEAEKAELLAEIEKVKKRSAKQKADKSGDSDELSKVTAKLEEIETRLSQQKKDESFQKATAGYEIPEEALPAIRRAFDPENPGEFEALLKPYKANADQASYRSPGAPSGDSVTTMTNPMHWSKEDIARKKANGTFRRDLEKGLGLGVSANPFARPRKG